MSTFTHLIDGKRAAAETHFDVIDPARGEPFAQSPEASKDAIDTAVAAAARTFGAWSRDEALRRRTLEAMGEILETKAAAIAELLSREQGKPLNAATAEVRGSAQSLRRTASEPLPAPEVLRED